MTADEDGYCVFNSLSIALGLIAIDTVKYDTVFEELKGTEEETGHNFDDGADRDALHTLIKLLVRRKIKLSWKVFRNRLHSSFHGAGQLLKFRLPCKIVVVGVYDEVDSRCRALLHDGYDF